MCFDLQGHQTGEHTVGQGLSLQASGLWIVPVWSVYRIKDRRQVWDYNICGPRADVNMFSSCVLNQGLGLFQQIKCDLIDVFFNYLFNFLYT
jgi:hypothetical protein